MIFNRIKLEENIEKNIAGVSFFFQLCAEKIVIQIAYEPYLLKPHKQNYHLCFP